MTAQVISFPFRPLARLRQVDRELLDRSLDHPTRLRLLAWRSWCLQMIEQERRAAK